MSVRAWAGVLVSMLLGSVAHAVTLSYGPIIGRGTTGDKMIIKFGTGASATSTVSYRKSGTSSFTTVNATGSCTHSPNCDYEADLSGLALDSTYDYYVTSGGTQSSTSTFATCPSPGMPLDLVFYGDSRSDALEHAKVVAQVRAKSPDIVFESGDVYYTGAYSGYLIEFFPAAKALVATVPFMASPGNHDASSDLATNFGLLFPTPKVNANDPWLPYYSFTCGNAKFVSLNSNDVNGAAQLQWLQNELGAVQSDANITHVFVWFHHAPYSVATHGDNNAVQQRWVPLFDDPKNKVTAVFAGHDHAYERLSNGSKVVYIVSGGAGASLYPIGSGSAATVVKAQSVYNFVSLHVAGTQVSATAYDDNGSTIETWTAGSAGGPDGGSNPDDGGMSGSDGGSSASDGGVSDGSASVSGGGGPTTVTSGGCDVGGSSRPGAWSWLLAIGLIWALGRRRAATTSRT